MLTDACATPRPPHRLMRHANSIVRLLHLHFSIGSTLRILRVLHVARPEGEVVPEQLHDERRVFVRLLAQRVQLRNRLVERLLRQVARALGTVQNLVVEDAEVERKAEANRVRGREVHERNVLRSLVREQRCLGSFLAIRACLELRQVAVVITLHLQVEHLALAAARAADEVVVQQLEDAAAYILELLLDLPAVRLDPFLVFGVSLGLFLLFYGRDNTPRGAARSDDVFVCHGQQVAFLDGELRGVVLLDHLVHRLHHFVVALRLLCELGYVGLLLARVRHG
mmetsp:Transcript_10739/g.24196  ORF Transcript_10739/g.24196 Transcript_10739/m.24196 type:complete len:282 (+) Transcript_10739:135-980(+)